MIRKNFLFYNTLNGAKLSVIKIVIANVLDAKLYLKTLIDKIESNPFDEELEKLLIWIFAK